MGEKLSGPMLLTGKVPWREIWQNGRPTALVSNYPGLRKNALMLQDFRDPAPADCWRYRWACKERMPRNQNKEEQGWVSHPAKSQRGGPPWATMQEKVYREVYGRHIWFMSCPSMLPIHLLSQFSAMSAGTGKGRVPWTELQRDWD